MSIIGEFDTSLDRIRRAITETAANDVADAARAAISESLSGYDFPYSRGSGGLSDPRNFEANVESTEAETTLTVRDIAPFQHPTGSSMTLAEAVIEGTEALMGEAGPRPFIDDAQKELDSGRAEQAFIQGLRRRGITVR